MIGRRSTFAVVSRHFRRGIRRFHLVNYSLVHYLVEESFPMIPKVGLRHGSLGLRVCIISIGEYPATIAVLFQPPR